MTEKVKSQTGLILRGSGYGYRQRIPKDVAERFGDRREIWKSLGTKDKATAVQRCQIERLKFTQEVAHYRALKKATQQEPPESTGRNLPRPPDELTDIDCERLTALWRAKVLEDDRWARQTGMHPKDDPDQLEAIGAQWYETFGEPLASVNTRFDPSPLVHHVRSLLEEYGLKVPQESPSFQRLALAVAREGVALRPILSRRDAGFFGDEIPKPQALPLPPIVAARVDAAMGQGAGTSFASLIDYWQARKKPQDRTAQEARHAFAMLQEFNPGTVLHAGNVEKRHVIALKDGLLDSGKASSTARKALNLIKAVFALAVANEKATRNPCGGVTIEKTKGARKARIPFGPEDLRAIFSSPVYTAGKRPDAGCGEAAYWLPLLALFTGARMEELAQLLTADVKKEGAIWCVYITDIPDDEDPEDEAPRKKLKTDSSRRRVPLHPDLVGQGFLRYVQAMQEADSVRLFPLVAHESGTARQQSANYSKWFGRYLRGTIKVTDPRKVFHSFRHGFKEAARACGIPTEHHHAMTGHATGNEGDKYGGDYFPLAPLAESMQKLAYPGLTLPAPWQMPAGGLVLKKRPTKKRQRTMNQQGHEGAAK